MEMGSGNETNSILQNPSVTYFNPGQYTIKLVVKNALGADSIIKSNFINVHALPQINFAGSPVAGCLPSPVALSDKSFSGSGSISGWEWDFGDGNLSSNQNPSHVYTAAGKYNVSLRAVNNFGCIGSATKTEFIEVYNTVKANFTNTLPNTCNQPANINFTNSSTGTGYHINGNLVMAAHLLLPILPTYINWWTYTVSLIVSSNANGCSDTRDK